MILNLINHTTYLSLYLSTLLSLSLLIFVAAAASTFASKKIIHSRRPFFFINNFRNPIFIFHHHNQKTLTFSLEYQKIFMRLNNCRCFLQGQSMIEL